MWLKKIFIHTPINFTLSFKLFCRIDHQRLFHRVLFIIYIDVMSYFKVCEWRYFRDDNNLIKIIYTLINYTL